MVETDTLDLETRKARARLRKLLTVNPGEVHLFTVGDERWLSDRYVMVKVTGDLAIQRLDAGPGGLPELRDGAYKLTAAHGLQPNDGWLVPDTAGLLKLIESREGAWYPMERTAWSVADSPAKLMLAYADKGEAPWALCHEHDRVPVAVNEGIWAAFEAAFPGCQFWWQEGSPYKVTDDAGRPVGYIARATVPADQVGIAHRIVGA